MRSAPREILAARHTRLREVVGGLGLDGLIVTHLPNIFYLTNFAGSAGIAVCMSDRLYLILDFRYGAATREWWDTPFGCPDAEIVPVDRTYDETLAELVGKLGPRSLGVEGINLSIQRAHQIAHRVGAALAVGAAPDPAARLALVSTDGVVENLRIVKDAHEIEMLRHGAVLLSAVAADVIDALKPEVSERDFAAEIDWRMKRAGFERCAFDTIVASGPNSALPHAHPGDRVVWQEDLVVLDFGGVYGGYCVDLTRTVALKKPDRETQRVYDAVLEAQQAAIAAVKPGVRAGEIDAAARDALGRYGLAEAFGHSTGHGLGIEIHEAPRIGPRREGTAGGPSAADQEITPGMVFTIEPGAYLPGWGGVRIEDDVLVTSDGVDVLTNVPTQLQAHGFRRN